MSSPGSQQAPAEQAERASAVVEDVGLAADDTLSPQSQKEWQEQRVSRPRNKLRTAGEPVPAAVATMTKSAQTEPPETEQRPAPEQRTESSGPGTEGEAQSVEPATAGASPDSNSVETDSESVAGESDRAPALMLDPASRSSVAEAHRVRRLTIVSVIAVFLVGLTVTFGIAWKVERASGPTANQAFVDAGDTAEVVGQVTGAIVSVYSYDYRTLPQNEAAAKAVITGRFAHQFDKVFGPVKRLAPQQQSVVRTTVPAAAVSLLQGGRARLLMMVNQSGVRGPSQEETLLTSRLVVDAQKVDGQWKISEVTPE